MKFDGVTQMMLDMLRDHRASEPKATDYPDEIGNAQQVYWAKLSAWDATDFGLRIMVGTRLIKLALDDLDDDDRVTDGTPVDP